LEPKASRPYRFHGIHGDIKPSNILWFPGRTKDDKGTLKIADFGAGDFNSTEHSRRPPDSISLTLSYRPPEYDSPKDPNDPLGDVQVSPAYDIWALGCLYLEFITWYMGGRDLLDEFQSSREKTAGNSSFFSPTEEVPYAEIKPAVNEVRDVYRLRDTTANYIT
jgi:serine/threonine protein kinase